MNLFKPILPVALFSFILFQPANSQITHQEGAEDTSKEVATHKMAAGNSFDQGVEMLHHMMYEQAADLFKNALKEDPQNALAHWGVAMTMLRPMWAPPNAADFQKGMSAIEKAISTGNPATKEREEIQVLYNYYTTANKEGYRKGLEVWKNSLEDLHNKYPDDFETASFYGLSLLATAPQDDKTYSQQRKAGVLMEELHKKDSQHPGPFHYSIHAYDNPVLAEKGIRFANAYDKLAPDVPHALHMPSHIFVRVGHWDETISWNLRSAESALRHSAENNTSYHHAHALDYLAYAYLQQGRDKKAQEILNQLNSIKDYQPNFAAAYATAAIPARYYLERKQWTEARNVKVETNPDFPWENFPQMEAITWWAQGLAAVRTKDLYIAREAVEHLISLEQQTLENDEEYWALLVNTQRKTVEAWILQAEGNSAEALALMNEAADQEDSVEKHPVTPGSILPARELLGDMYLLQDKPEEAVIAYQETLKISPNRFNSLYGAGQAAVLAGKDEMGRTYYQQLLEKRALKESEREELDIAKAFLQKN